MDFAYFVHEPLLYMVFLLFIIGLATRIAIFFYTLIRSAKKSGMLIKNREDDLYYTFKNE